jgi:hypothetical protein
MSSSGLAHRRCCVPLRCAVWQATYDRATISAQRRTVQHATARPHPDLAAEHRRRRDIGFRVDRRGALTMADLHQPTVHHTLAATPTAVLPGHHTR